ncbi:glycerophosphodiester phosphodiesterase family protein [Anianabacter salinae]|uniref:glycerophosphodiester phosphodiesterase family protein n=1 Tax=Anianabacter salinae TaxID=2851023 RepID=UPI00225DF65B|nr:glycerophosphodiester phosphodiesterase family protein [Anianabacter salinae]MBV0913289.1 phosphodiesterase [Anianabacter salinae]
MTALPAAFLHAPLAHRALHDKAAGRPENSRAAVRAAVAKGYGIEIDVQLTADGRAVVFHDYDLGRLTIETGPLRQRSVAELQAIPLMGGTESVPTLTDILAEVGGRVPVLIEVKDQDGALGPDVGALEAAVVEDIADYAGPLAVMSFNPHSMAAMKRLAPHVPRGLTTCGYDPAEWPTLPPKTCERLRGIPDFEHLGACFISHQASDLDRPRIAQIKSDGAAVLCWTIRSAQAEAEARRIADNVTFEGYAAPIPAP